MSRKIVFVFSCLILFQAMPARAIDYFDTKITDNEKVVFAYFRLGNIVPKYDEWIKDGYIYRGTPENFRDDIFLQEQLRLGRGYSEFDPKVNVLRVKAPIFVKFSTSDVGAHYVSFVFSHDDESYIPTFNFPYIDDQKIFMVIRQVENFSHLPVPSGQYDIIKNKVRASEDQWFQAVLDIKVRATRVETKSPKYKDGVMGWPMYGEIAHIRCMLPPRYDGEVILWDWVAPWYEQTYKEEIMPDDKKYPHPFDPHK